MSTPESTEKKHSSLGERIKGAAHIVHGIGEDFRGSVMGAFESASGSAEAKAKDEEIVAKGKTEIEQGIARMKGLRAPTTAPESHAEGTAGEQPQEQPVKETAPGPTPAPPPSPVQNRQAEPEMTQQEQSGQSRVPNQPATESLLVDSETGAKQVPTTSQSQTSQTGDKGSIGGTSADAPQGPGNLGA